MASFRFLILPSALLATFAFARTDLTGCTSTDVSSPAGASVAWYVPGTGEMCDFLDCGGGMAPPATNVPGCPLYSGTSTYSPSYMPGYGSATAAASSSWIQASETASGSVTSGSASASWSAWESDTASSSWDLYTSAAASASSTWASGSSAWSSGAAGNTASPLICSIGSCSPASTSTYTWSTSTRTIVQTSSAAAAAGVASNRTMAGSTGSIAGATIGSTSNGTAPSATASPSSTVSTGGAVDTAKAWMGAGVIMGLGAVVVAL